MRSIHVEEIAHLSPVITRAAESAPVVVKPADETPVNPLLEALEKFPAQLAEAMAYLPAPVMAPRPTGSWIIDVKRDGAGLMSGMTAKFHETK